MANLTSFEQLQCWKEARELIRLVYTASNEGKISKDFAVKDQIRRAALSVMNNIAEGFGRGTNPQFIRFLDIAQSSCMEVKSITYVIEDFSYIAESDIHVIRQKAEETKARIRALIAYLRTHPKPHKP